MRSVCFSMVKNEEDIVEAFVRHTLLSVDHLYIADNLSVDGTGEILRSLVSEGLPLTVTLDDEQALVQNEKMTNMYRNISRDVDFDFAFFLDVDEFLHLDKQVMHSIYDDVGPGHAFYLPRTNYLYIDEPIVGDPLSIFKSMTITDAKPEDPKSMIFHENELCRRFRIGNGNHHVRDWAREGKVVSETQPKGFASISHFPIRSVDQYLRKSLLGSLALQLRTRWDGNPRRGIGNHWHTQAALILDQNADVTPLDLRKNLYGDDPLSRQGKHLPLDPAYGIRYAHLMRSPSLIVQLVNMYSLTIDTLWKERESSKQMLAQ